MTRQAGAEWFPSSASDAPVAIARAALEHARSHYVDVLLVDTAGRLAIDEKLMAEIRELHAALNPVETLFGMYMVYEPLFGRFARREFFHHHAGLHGAQQPRVGTPRHRSQYERDRRQCRSGARARLG